MSKWNSHNLGLARWCEKRCEFFQLTTQSGLEGVGKGPPKTLVNPRLLSTGAIAQLGERLLCKLAASPQKTPPIKGFRVAPNRAV